jgi:hypothetical protein
MITQAELLRLQTDWIQRETSRDYPNLEKGD